jgi:hypothetical protein
MTNPSADRTYLKWAGQLQGYSQTILPGEAAYVDCFAIRAEEPGVFLHSSSDLVRVPVFRDDGDYLLHYKLFAEGFLPLSFTLRLQLRWAPLTQQMAADDHGFQHRLEWDFHSSAELADVQVMDALAWTVP